MKTLRGITSLLLLAGIAQGGDWQYSLGVHDFTVPQADSDTFGIDARATFDRHTASGRHYFGSADLFVDHDKDDWIPITFPSGGSCMPAPTGISGNPAPCASAGPRTSTHA
jgi:hypothetical protein